MMTNDEKVQYWIEISDDDVETTEVLLNGKRYLFAMYTCHLFLEKIFKAYYASLTQKTPPFVHGLIYISVEGGFWEDISEDQQKFIKSIEAFDIKGRYPDYKRHLASTLDQSNSREIYEQSKALQLWIKEKISLRK
jgi:HEPN domain-containing protein